jgi:hypothetical protein
MNTIDLHELEDSSKEVLNNTQVQFNNKFRRAFHFTTIANNNRH